ncbi:hypothetical protein Cni_G07870 [Canna indica]|uniref:DUF538 family protein n=1 Tax=Canna indica TaxID=4628 RepID=A0AAQ3Q684_9LILI|nr:hypothetical protein Cni_G07870 [Canna indica]
MAAKAVFLFFIVSFLSLARVSFSGDPNPSSAYDELKSSGFPVGLLPANVLGYSLNRTSGDFAVRLDDHCRVTLPPDNYSATFSSRITGRLADRRISSLEGIKVRALFRWWAITGIRSSGDELVFEVGLASAKYPSRNFDESPECEGRSHDKADS